MLRRIGEQRRKLILAQAERYLEPGETVSHWVRAKQVEGRGEGFVFLTPRRCIVHLTGKQEAPGSLRWEDVTSWGVAARARGGPILAMETASGRHYVQLRATTAAMAKDVADFVKAFAERAPRPRRQMVGPEHLGVFEATDAPHMTEHKMTIADLSRRILISILGITLVVGAVVIIPLPGPWSFLVAIAGLAILASEYDWARDALAWMKQRYNQVSDKIRARRQSAP